MTVIKITGYTKQSGIPDSFDNSKARSVAWNLKDITDLLGFLGLYDMPLSVFESDSLNLFKFSFSPKQSGGAILSPAKDH
jgi:hypothetical protein